MPRHTDKPDLSDLQHSILALTETLYEFQQSQDQRHESYLAIFHTQDQRHGSYLSTFQTLHNQIQAKPLLTSLPNAQPLEPPKLTLQPFDGSNPLEWVFFRKNSFPPIMPLNPTIIYNMFILI